MAAKRKLAICSAGKCSARLTPACPTPRSPAIIETLKIVSTIAGSTRAEMKASRLDPIPPKLLALSSPSSIRKKVERASSPVMVKASTKLT